MAKEYHTPREGDLGMWDVKFCVGDLIIRKNGLTLGVVHAVESHNSYGARSRVLAR